MTRVIGNRWDRIDPGARHPHPRVTVVVTHYDQPRELARTLHALARQTYPARLLEVVVADDGSATPPTVPPGVALVRQEDRGFRAAAARNLGARAGTGEIVCFLDADTAPEPGYVEAITRLPALEPDALTVGRRRHADLRGLPIDAPLEREAPARALPEPAWLADAYARSRDLLDADDRSYRYVISAVAACSRALFDELGGFDETFSSYGGEDWEFAHRAWQAGAVLAHVPDAVAWHDGPDWAGRGDDAERAREGDAQTLRLAAAIGVDGSAGRGLIGPEPDVVVRLYGRHPVASVFVFADALLAALPRARVVLDEATGAPAIDDDPRVMTGPAPDARVTWTLERPVLVADGAALAGLFAGLGAGEVGAVDVRTEDDRAAGVAMSRRARRRAARRDDEAGFTCGTSRVPGLHALRPDPHLEAWVGRWGALERFVEGRVTGLD